MANTKRLPEFVFFGDSLTEWSFDDVTEGFGLYFENAYKGKATIVNEGQAGYTSTDLQHDFDRIITRATSPTSPKTLLFTIFLGANDACNFGDKEYVPWPLFSANMRAFIETILTQDAMPDAKIVLITPPPTNGPIEDPDKVKYMSKDEIHDANVWKMDLPRYKTYMSKKRYAEGVMHMAKEYEETGRVVGLDYWNALVDARIAEGWRAGDDVGDEEMIRVPGCGLIGSSSFGDGWFTDGLHLDRKAYDVLSKTLMEVVTRKWPELAPERLTVT